MKRGARGRTDPLELALAGIPARAGAALGGPQIPCELHAKQKEFLALTCLEALYGGAAGGGKTEALLADAAIGAGHRGFKGLILRRTFKALNLPDSIMNRALQWWGRDHWNDIDKRFTFSIGSVIQFGYCDNIGDLDRYKSAQFHKIYIDEVTEWPLEWYTFLFSRIRRLRGDSVALGMRSATNPDGIGAEWVRRRFSIPDGEIVERTIASEECTFVPARAEDNPSLDLISYEQSLSRLGPVRYQQLRLGRWLRDGEGLVYGHYDTGKNQEPSREPLNHYILGIDFGFTDATAFCILGWRAHERVVVVERCWKETGLTPSDVGERVQELMSEYDFTRIIGDTGGLGKGYAEEMRIRWGIPIEPAEKVNKRGYIDLINGALHRGELKLCMPECEALEAEWLILPWHEGREKESAGFENHCADATLYAWRAATAFFESPGPKQLTEEEAAEAAEEARREARRRDLQGGEGWDRWRATSARELLGRKRR